MSDKSTTRCSASDLAEAACRPARDSRARRSHRTLAASQRAYKTAQSNRKWPIMVFPRNHKFRINKKKNFPPMGNI